MAHRLTRRSIMTASLAALATRLQQAAAQSTTPAFSYPVGLPGLALGDGFFIRDGFCCENTWYLPRSETVPDICSTLAPGPIPLDCVNHYGWWHTGEDWYLNDEAETAGVSVYAAAAGQVVFAGWEYPGRVVILKHGDDLYSMYGHLDRDLAVEPEQEVARGDLLGTVLYRTDGLAPSHLHFEIRTFLMNPVVNGDTPRYDVACGYKCPPGPGYWPIDAPELPSALGWRNPTHVIAHRTWPDGVSRGTEVVVAQEAPATAVLWTESRFGRAPLPIAAVPVAAGDRFPLLEIQAGAEATTGTSAEAYRLRYRIQLPDGTEGWVQAAIPSTNDTGSDGRPSSVWFAFLPAVATPE